MGRPDLLTSPDAGTHRAATLGGSGFLDPGGGSLRLPDISWSWFALVLLAADLSTVGYLKDAGVGAVVYNLGTVAGLAGGTSPLGHRREAFIAAGSIWLAHIGMDRALGYGLS